jgi:hypothetical protein
VKPVLIICGMIALTIALIVAGVPWLLAFLSSCFINGIAMAAAEEITGDR